MQPPSFGTQFPALRGRRRQLMTNELDHTRRVLWQAFQHGELTEEEFARTLDQLEPPLLEELDQDTADVSPQAR
jgi:hypothetical protein